MLKLEILTLIVSPSGASTSENQNQRADLRSPLSLGQAGGIQVIIFQALYTPEHWQQFIVYCILGYKKGKVHPKISII